MDVMLYIAGSTTAFRCACGCNVFTKASKRVDELLTAEGEEIYLCNGCRARYKTPVGKQEQV